MSKIGSWFSGLSKAGKAGVVLVSLFVVGATAAPTTPSKPTQPPVAPTTSGTKADVIEKKTTTVTQTIPFSKTTVNDSTLEQGKTSIKTTGVNGVKTLTYEITLTNGTQTDKKLIKEETTTQPISEVTAIGTYVAPRPVLNCPNGTYTNSAGNEVCSPYSSPSAPAGATARCGDGTYSFSQSRSGTCSHHGGVAEWL